MTRCSLMIFSLGQDDVMRKLDVRIVRAEIASSVHSDLLLSSLAPLLRLRSGSTLACLTRQVTYSGAPACARNENYSAECHRLTAAHSISIKIFGLKPVF